MIMLRICCKETPPTPAILVFCLIQKVASSLDLVVQQFFCVPGKAVACTLRCGRYRFQLVEALLQECDALTGVSVWKCLKLVIFCACSGSPTHYLQLAQWWPSCDEVDDLLKAEAITRSYYCVFFQNRQNSTKKSSEFDGFGETNRSICMG